MTVRATITSAASPAFDVVDTFTAEHSYSSGLTRRLSVCQVERWGLRTECFTPEDATTQGESTWLLPEAGLRLTYKIRRSRHSKTTPTVLSAVKIERNHRSWHTQDLLLGLEISDSGAARFVNSAEYAAAVATGALSVSDAELAMEILHRTASELSRCRYDVRLWLGYQGIVDAWPPRF